MPSQGASKAMGAADGAADCPVIGMGNGRATADLLQAVRVLNIFLFRTEDWSSNTFASAYCHSYNVRFSILYFNIYRN